MKILDWYILKKYLKTFFYVVMIIISIVCVIDYSEKADDFIEKNVTWKEIIVDYYLNYIPWMSSVLSPISVFITTVLVTSRLSSHTEIIAMLSSGMSFLRFMRPYFIGSTILGALIFLFVGWIIPPAAKIKNDFENQYVRNPFYFNDRNVHIRTSDSTFVYLHNYNNRTHTGFRFTLEKIKGEELVERLDAPKISWDTAVNKWKIPSYTIHSFDGLEESITSGKNMDTVLNLLPKDFESQHEIYVTMTIPELNAHITEMQNRGKDGIQVFLNEKHERYAYPFAIIILTAMGVIVSAKKSRRGTGWQIAFGFALAGVYVLFVMLSRNVAQAGGLEPWFAAWLPNITFCCISIFMYFTVPR